MKWTMGGAALLAAMVTLVPATSEAQTGPRGQRGMGAEPRGAGVEMILRQKDRLELTDAQVKQLDQIRQEEVQHRSQQQAQMAELRSKVRAGLLEPDSLWKQIEARRAAATARQEAQRSRVEGVLNDAQKQQLEEWAGQARAFRMGRQSALRGGRGFGPGAWGGPGPQPGMGPGMAPGMGLQQWGPRAMMGPMRGRAMMLGGRRMGGRFHVPPDSIPPR